MPDARTEIKLTNGGGDLEKVRIFLSSKYHIENYGLPDALCQFSGKDDVYMSTQFEEFAEMAIRHTRGSSGSKVEPCVCK